MQRGAKARGANIYPPYSSIAKVKKECYPDNYCITVTETEASIQLQSLLDLTTKRLVQVQTEILEQLPTGINEINMIYKWGLDGSGGHSIYKQTFTDPDIRHANSNIVFSNLVPLEMSGPVLDSENKQIYWKNVHTSATRYCRPIKFTLQKETKENVTQHYIELKAQIDNLLPTEVSYKLIFQCRIRANIKMKFRALYGHNQALLYLLQLLSENKCQSYVICSDCQHKNKHHVCFH